MASFVVKECQPLSVLKKLIVQTMHSRSYGGKTQNSLLFTMDKSDRLLFFFLFLTEKDPFPLPCFYSLLLHYINGVFACNFPMKKQLLCDVCIFKAWSQAIFWPKLVLQFYHYFNCYDDPWVLWKTCQAKFPKYAWRNLKSAPRLFNSAVWNYKSALRVFILLGLGRQLGPHSLAVNISYFALFSLIICILDDFLDTNCSSRSILAFCHYAAFLGWLISAAQ